MLWNNETDFAVLRMAIAFCDRSGLSDHFYALITHIKFHWEDFDFVQQQEIISSLRAVSKSRELLCKSIIVNFLDSLNGGH